VREHFDGVSDDSWISVCGEQASVYAARAPTYLVSVFLSTGQSLVIGLTFVSQFLQLLRKRSGILNREVVRNLQIQASLLLRRKRGHPLP
jgi:hypothetical protein